MSSNKKKLSLMEYLELSGHRSELEKLAKSIPDERIEEASKLLKSLISDKMYKRQTQNDEALRYHLFGQKTCGYCGYKYHHNSHCWNCRTNHPG